MGKKLKLVSILIIFFIASFLSTFYMYTPISPISNSFSSVTLGTTSYGSVIRDGPYGNPSSSKKIAIIEGYIHSNTKHTLPS
jgi:hypothetical protein